jgi:hypothetical protein
MTNSLSAQPTSLSKKEELKKSPICYGILHLFAKFCIWNKIFKMRERTEEPLSYKITKDYGGYIVLEAKHSVSLRLLSGLPFILSSLPLLIFALYFILYKGKFPSSLLIPLIAGAFLLLLGLGIMGCWKSIIIDRVMGTFKFCNYHLWRSSCRVFSFSEIEGVEIVKSKRILPDFFSYSQKGEETSYSWYEINLLHQGRKIYIDGSSNEGEVESLAMRIAEVLGREVKRS